MDRGVDAANTLVTYLFLFLMPAMLEVLAVIILFFFQYANSAMSLIVFGGIAMYIATTIFITEWRKKFREATNKHDNDFHDKATDSIINYETVKYFTGERFEISRFVKSVTEYQINTSKTSYSLSLLNISQNVILMSTLFGTMYVAGRAVVNGRMNIGGWIAVTTWVQQIFVPLNFLGSAYAAIYQGFIDIRNLSELLSEQPDVVDLPHAPHLPITKVSFFWYNLISFSNI